MPLPAGHIFLSVVALAGSPTQSREAPPALPRLAPETFPAASRDALTRLYKEALARPNDAAAVGSLGRVLQAWEQWDAAHAAYARAQALAPKAFDWHYLDAVVLQRLVRHPEAVEALRRALSVDPGYLPARLRLAEAWFEVGDLQESRTLFEPLVSVPATEPAALVGLGRIAAAEGQHADAVRAFERAITLFPELGAAYYGLARSYRALGRSADAQRAVEQHAQYGARWPRLDDPVLGSVASVREDARATLQRGISLSAAGDVAGAIEAHTTALARDPSLVQAHANLVGLYGRAGDWAKAEEHYRAAAAKGFNNAEMHYDYAVVLGMQGQWDRAEAAYRKALEVNPLHPQSRNNLGQVLERRRDFDGALAEYRQALEAQPTFRLARFNLGRMWLVKGDTRQAIAAFEALQEPVDAETPRYLFALSTALVRAGKVEDGRRLGGDAQNLAVKFGQTDFARAIAAELAKLK
ncbi:MAG TPA: tetratricopeptide repeat protein [Vicinamibacterales bacterium]|nr:tetratricopeptide repeat protein [Vicinamibacterales bacterium]